MSRSGAPETGPVWHFVRHAPSLANEQRWLAGHVDVPLSEKGEAKARASTHLLAGLPIARAFTSDLRRAWHTAELILADHAVPVRQIQALRERDLGEWERVSHDTLDAGDPHLNRWDLGPPGGESPQDVALRYLAFFAVCPDIDGDTVVVGHGLALRSLLGLIDGIPTDEIPKGRYKNLELQTRRLDRARFEALLDALRAGDLP